MKKRQGHAMNEFEKNALLQISLLDNELRILNDQCRVIEAKIAGLRMFLSASEVHNDAPTLPAVDWDTVNVTDSPRTTLKELVTNAALRILADGKPRNTAGLLDAFAAEGIEIESSNEIATVSSILSRDGRFKANRTHGWTLAKKESPAGNEAFDLQPKP